MDNLNLPDDYTKQLDKAVDMIKASEMRRHEYMIMMIREMEIREEGRQEGIIFGTIEAMQDDGKDETTIKRRLMDKFHLEVSEAVEYLLSASNANNRITE